jgi:hypothetical protein
VPQHIHILRIREFRVLNGFEALFGLPDLLAFHVSSPRGCRFRSLLDDRPAIHFLVVRIEGGVPKHETCVTPWPLQAPTRAHTRPSPAKRSSQERIHPVADAEKPNCQPHHFICEASFQPNCRTSEIFDHFHN